MRGILADVNCEGQFDALVQLLHTGYRLEYWETLALSTLRFADVQLSSDSPDSTVWELCQQHQLILITANRNADEPDSLENTIRSRNTPDSLPVVTISDSNRIMTDRDYAERATDRLLEILFDFANQRGIGRLFIP